MNNPYLVPSGKTVAGRLTVPPSKSVTHRCFNLSLLSRTPTVVETPLMADDTRLFLAALERCGFDVARQGDEVRLTPGQIPARETEILCGNAGTMYRFLVATLTTVPGRWRLDGSPRLRERPVGSLIEALRPLGAEIQCLDQEGFAPLQIRGGSLRGGETVLEAGESSQYLSAVLMAATRAPQPVTVRVRSLTSSPYVAITLEAMSRFGARVNLMDESTYRVEPSSLDGGRLRVEGDYSAAAYPAAAAALTGGKVFLSGIRPDASQGDRRFLSVLEEIGAQVSWSGEGVEVCGGSLRSVEADFSDMPDQVPTLAALAPFCRGTTRISNVAHLRIKESDRLRAMAVQLTRLGVEVEENPDGLVIHGGWAEGGIPTHEVVVETYDDHRIAMSLALVGLRRPGVAVGDPGVVAKSYPEFWSDLETLLRDESIRTGRGDPPAGA